MTTSLRVLTTNLLLLSWAFSLLPHVDAERQRAPDTRHGVKWLQQDTSVLVRLETPDLPLWNPEKRIGEDIPTAFIFNFTLQNKQILLLNNVPILPLSDALHPSTYHVPQTAIDLTQFSHGNLPDLTSCPSFKLDYYRGVPRSEHPDSRYNIYNTHLEFDVLGAEVAGYNTLLVNDNQRIIRVSVAELAPYQEYPYDKPISQRFYRITDVVLQDRYPYNTFARPDQLQKCIIWSWICSDFDEFPWYHYVYREAFDEFGKVGSLRHSLSQRYNVLNQKLGFRQATFIVVIVIIVIFLTPVYGVIVMFRRMKAYFEPYGEQDRRYEELFEREDEQEDLVNEETENHLEGEKSRNPHSQPGQGEGSKPLPPPCQMRFKS